MLIFIIVPLLLVLLFSLTDESALEAGKIKITLDNFKRFYDPLYLNILKRSVILAVVSTVACLILGYPMALILSRQEPRVRNILSLLFILPMWINFLLRTYAWMTLLSKNGIINSFLSFIGLPTLNLMYNDGAVLLGMIYNFLPFMILPIYSVLIKLDDSLIEASYDLGGNKANTFRKVIFPLSLPGVITGITMVFMPAVSTFVISKLLGGGKYVLIGNLVERQFLAADDWHFGSAISIVMMVMILIAMGITAKYDNDREGDGGLW
ncbi:spermidine/putrescine transport system permease protein PotB [Gottschalkia acidurici 9a]|uniref:Spermidine/putrescine transport system permease protein PotB n=1 Tax=Gottschalkia acidurici (strain ATCC 7906 / DSM 604 / BCRC 14475 / CIP 104303 / KCTC 5404 / NCIMB 10678 / 9a) TaxID=1128398 RepID=K0AXR6_GOTA9|nr:ABC transporter permease [Gottschalkia acidurici]AFS77969.1 spermidine/putrescine transport system permease protein PotB [Gottschalkia acidurici 9a]